MLRRPSFPREGRRLCFADDRYAVAEQYRFDVLLAQAGGVVADGDAVHGGRNLHPLHSVISVNIGDGGGIRVFEFTDEIVQTILTNHSTALTRVPFQHESLLVDRKEKKLSQAEKRLAQKGYEMEKQASNKTTSVSSLSYKFYKQPSEANSFQKSSVSFVQLT